MLRKVVVTGLGEVLGGWARNRSWHLGLWIGLAGFAAIEDLRRFAAGCAQHQHGTTGPCSSPSNRCQMQFLHVVA